MEDILFNDDGSGLIADTAISLAHVYTAEEIALMLAALGAMVASVVYSFKHIKSSSCLGSKCQQEVVDVVHVENGTGLVRQETDV